MRQMFSSERVLIVGVCISVVAGFVVGIWSSVTVGLGIAVGLLGSVLSLQLDTVLRLQRQARRQDEAGRLLSALDSGDDLLSLFREAAEGCATARALPSGERLDLNRRAREELIPLVRSLKELGRGRVHASPDRTDMLLSQMRQTSHSLRAVSLEAAGGVGWWHSTPGKSYWEANHRLITEHHVATERIFICDEYTEAVRTVAEQQARAGATIWIALRDDVPPELQIRFAIFDDSIVHAVIYGSTGKAIEFIYSADAADVVQALDRFDRLRTCSQRVAVELEDSEPANDRHRRQRNRGLQIKGDRQGQPLDGVEESTNVCNSDPRAKSEGQDPDNGRRTTAFDGEHQRDEGPDSSHMPR
jgi:hypothetical protein